MYVRVCMHVRVIVAGSDGQLRGHGWRDDADGGRRQRATLPAQSNGSRRVDERKVRRTDLVHVLSDGQQVRPHGRRTR